MCVWEPRRAIQANPINCLCLFLNLDANEFRSRTCRCDFFFFFSFSCLDFVQTPWEYDVCTFILMALLTPNHKFRYNYDDVKHTRISFRHSLHSALSIFAAAAAAVSSLFFAISSDGLATWSVLFLQPVYSSACMHSYFFVRLKFSCTYEHCLHHVYGYIMEIFGVRERKWTRFFNSFFHIDHFGAADQSIERVEAENERHTRIADSFDCLCERKQNPRTEIN